MQSSSIKMELEIILSITEKLLEFGAKTLSLNLEHKEDDYFAFMAAAFCWRQIKHLESLKALYTNGCFQDMLIIARSMLEGFAYLQWGDSEKQKVPLKWLSFCWVTDYRLALKQIKNGILEDATINQIRSGIDKYCNQFYKSNKIMVDFINDPFHKFWHIDDKGQKVSPSNLFESFKAPELYEVYKDMSDWIHWNIRGIGIITKRDDAVVSFHYENEQNAAYSFASGLLAFVHCFILLDNYYNLGTKDELNAIKEEYIGKIFQLKKSDLSS